MPLLGPWLKSIFVLSDLQLGVNVKESALQESRRCMEAPVQEIR